MGIFDNIFKDKHASDDNSSDNSELLQEIETLKVSNVSKDGIIENLRIELTNLKNSTLSPKQLQVMERNLKSFKEENLSLKKLLEDLKEEKNSTLLDNSEFVYRIDIEYFLSGVKFADLRNFLVKKDISFIDQFENEALLKEIKSIKNGEVAIEKYRKYKDGILPWDLKVLACKGEKVQKIFKSKRKFVNYLVSKNFEFMEDIKDFNFETLTVKNEFNKAAIAEIAELCENYFEKYLIKKF